MAVNQCLLDFSRFFFVNLKNATSKHTSYAQSSSNFFLYIKIAYRQPTNIDVCFFRCYGDGKICGLRVREREREDVF